MPGGGGGGVSSPTRWADPSLRAPAPRHGPAATPGPCIQVPPPPLHHSLPQAGARGRCTHTHHSPKGWRGGAVVAVGRGALFISKIIPQRKILYATQSKESSPLMKTKTCPKDFARAPLVEQAPWLPRPCGWPDPITVLKTFWNISSRKNLQTPQPSHFTDG